MTDRVTSERLDLLNRMNAHLDLLNQDIVRGTAAPNGGKQHHGGSTRDARRDCSRVPDRSVRRDATCGAVTCGSLSIDWRVIGRSIRGDCQRQRFHEDRWPGLTRPSRSPLLLDVRLVHFPQLPSLKIGRVFETTHSRRQLYRADFSAADISLYGG